MGENQASIDGVRLRHPADIGHAIRSERTAQDKTQAELAAAAGVSRRWLAGVEKGHPTAEVGLVLAVFRQLGFDLAAARKPSPVFDADAALASLADAAPQAHGPPGQRTTPSGEEGLGEMDTDGLAECAPDLATRTLRRLTREDPR